MAIGKLPLTTNPEETFSIIISDQIHEMRQRWNNYGFWTLDVGNYIYGVKLVTGIFLLSQYAHIPFDMKIAGDVEPTRNNLSDLRVEIYAK
jgi:hypothetical protein